MSESDFKPENNRNKVIGILDDFALKVIDRDVKNIKHDESNLKVAFLPMLCLESIFIDEKFHATWPIFIIDGRNLLEMAKRIVSKEELVCTNRFLLHFRFNA